MKKFLVGLLAFFGTLCSVAVFVYTGYYIGKETTEYKEILVSTTAESTGVTAPVEVEEAKRAVDEMAVFQKFTADYWEQGLSFSQIEGILNELAVIIAYDLELESTPTVKAIYDKSVTYFGVYKPDSHIIQLNYYKIFQSSKPEMESVETLSHELRHDFQRERYDAGLRTPLECSWSNYKTIEEDGFNAYYTQLCEKDARAYATFFRNYFESLITNY